MTGKITCWRIKESVINNNVMTTSMSRTNPEKLEHIGTILKGAEKTVIGLAKIKELILRLVFGWFTMQVRVGMMRMSLGYIVNAQRIWERDDKEG